MNLLIVDDEIIAVKGILKGVHWDLLPFEKVLSCTSVSEAKKIFQEETVDILLCDIEMPEGGGMELLSWVRECGYETECIFLTCHNEFSYAQRAVKLQGMDYLLKPVPYEELQEILREASDKVRSKKEKQLYQEYGRLHVGQYQENTSQQEEKSGRVIVENTKKYIQEHLAEDLTAELLAGQAYISKTHLFRLFRQEENMTPVEYITRTRLFYARELLKNPEMSITRIATSVGYSNYSYFTRLFRKEFGMTPSQYQRKYGSGGQDDRRG